MSRRVRRTEKRLIPLVSGNDQERTPTTNQRRASPQSLEEPRGRWAELGLWADGLASEAVSKAEERGGPVLHAGSRPLDWEPSVDVLDSSVEDAFFFGQGGTTFLGVGAACSLETEVPSLRGYHLTGDAHAVRVVGGWGFPAPAGRSRAGIWRDFPPSRWVVPAVALTSQGGGARVALVVPAAPSSNAAALAARYRRLLGVLDARGAPSRSLPRLASSRSLPSEARWLSLAERLVRSISRGDLKKVVLSRSVALRFAGVVPPSAVVERLASLNPGATPFAVKRRGAVFLGATPESLFTAKGGRVEVDCLAASSSRSDDAASDDLLGEQLLGDRKSGTEHRLVVQAAVAALSPMSSTLEAPRSPVLKKLATIQHLYTPLRATLLKGVDAWAVARALWPNPAIAGEPREGAVRWIQSSEELDRGWFSGVVGVVDAYGGEASLAVGIRSGIVRGRDATIYAGVGVVEGSEPRLELEETGWKLAVMRRALGLEGG